MIPPKWKNPVCSCGSTNFTAEGFCKNCEAPIVAYPSSFSGQRRNLAISRWSKNFPTEQNRRCMVCGRRGEFPVAQRATSGKEILTRKLVKLNPPYLNIRKIFWKNQEPPETLIMNLVSSRETRTLFNVPTLPTSLKTLSKVSEQPRLCIECMLKEAQSYSTEEQSSKATHIEKPKKISLPRPEQVSEVAEDPPAENDSFDEAFEAGFNTFFPS